MIPDPSAHFFAAATWLVVNLLAAAVRWLIETGGMVVTYKDYATLLRVLPVIMFAASIYRLLVRRRWFVAASILAFDYYFLYNRLTVFSVRPLVLAEMIGNIGLIALAVSLMLPQRIDQKKEALK